MKNFIGGFGIAVVLLYVIYLFVGTSTAMSIEGAKSACQTAMIDNAGAAPGSAGEKLVKEKCEALMHKVYGKPNK